LIHFYKRHQRNRDGLQLGGADLGADTGADIGADHPRGGQPPQPLCVGFPNESGSTNNYSTTVVTKGEKMTKDRFFTRSSALKLTIRLFKN